jgi:hypothetical protein
VDSRIVVRDQSSPDDDLKTDHSFSLAGQRFLTLHYEIERLTEAARAGGRGTRPGPG